MYVTASMKEDSDPQEIDEYEAQYFDNLQTRQLDQNNARSGVCAALTNTHQPAGPSNTLRIKVDDEISLEVFERYTTTDSNWLDYYLWARSE